MLLGLRAKLVYFKERRGLCTAVVVIAVEVVVVIIVYVAISNMV